MSSGRGTGGGITGETILDYKDKLDWNLNQLTSIPITSTVVSPIPAKKSEFVIAKGNSAASSHYWRPQDINVLDNIENHRGPSVLLLNNELISSTQRGRIPLNILLSKEARQASILTQLQDSSLISLGKASRRYS